MRTRSLIGMLALLCVGWLFVLGPALLVIIMIFWTKGLMRGELPFIVKKKGKE